MIQEASGIQSQGSHSVLPMRVTPEIVKLALKQLLLVPDCYFFEELVLKERYMVLKARLSLLPHESLINLFFRKVINHEAMLNQARFEKDHLFHILNVDGKLHYLAERLSSKPRNELLIFLEVLDTLTLQAKL